MAWFGAHTGEPFVPQSVTDYDVRARRDAAQEQQKPATVNRKLANNDPTRRVGGEDQQTTAPKALSEQALNKILR